MKLKLVLPAVVMLGGVLVCSTVTYGKPEFTKKEKKACAFCHPSGKTKELTEAGKYYKEHKSLEGYTEKK